MIKCFEWVQDINSHQVLQYRGFRYKGHLVQSPSVYVIPFQVFELLQQQPSL